MKSSIIKFSLFLFSLMPLMTQAFDKFVVDDEGQHFTIHLNKSFFVSGETIWYALYTPDALKGTEITIQVQLIDWTGRIKDHYFLKTEGKTSLDGYYKIPFDWSTGFYSLVFSGIDDQSQKKVELAKTDVPIYNDLEKIPSGIKIQELPNTLSNNIGSTGELQISLDKASYNQGDNVNVSVLVKNEDGEPMKANLSISVVDDEIAGDHLLNSTTVRSFYDNQLPANKMSNRLFAFGKLLNKDGQPLQANIVGAYSSLENVIHYLKSDINGQYALKLEDFYGEKPLQIVLYKNQESFDVEPENKISLPAGMRPAKVTYTQEILDYIQQSRLRKKVYQFYGAVENNLTVAPTSTKRKTLKAGQTYKITEYESFENLGEFFIEVPTALKFRVNKDDTFGATIVNPRQYTSSTRTLDGDPLFIIDGKVTKNADFVGKMKLNETDEVKLYYNPNKLNDHYRAIAVGGIAEIKTTVDDFHIPLEDEEDIFKAKGIQLKGAFKMSTTESPDIPAFSPQLYWNPLVPTDKDGTTRLSFQQSDDVSTFIIKIVAQTEAGEMIYGEKKYEVKRNKG